MRERTFQVLDKRLTFKRLTKEEADDIQELIGWYETAREDVIEYARKNSQLERQIKGKSVKWKIGLAVKRGARAISYGLLLVPPIALAILLWYLSEPGGNWQSWSGFLQRMLILVGIVYVEIMVIRWAARTYQNTKKKVVS